MNCRVLHTSANQDIWNSPKAFEGQDGSLMMMNCIMLLEELISFIILLNGVSKLAQGKVHEGSI